MTDLIRYFGSGILRTFGLQRRKWVEVEIRGKRVAAIETNKSNGTALSLVPGRLDREVDALDATSRLMMQMGEFEALERFSLERLSSDPADGQALALYASCRLRLNDPATAIEYHIEAEACGTFSIAQRREYAEALDMSGRTSDARRLLLGAMRQFPSAWQFFWDYAALIEQPEHYMAMHDLITDLRAAQKSHQALERSLAKGAILVGEFATAERIYRRLVAQQLKALQDKIKSTPDTALRKISRAKQNDLSDGKGERCLLDAKQALDGGGVPFFLMAGTVLGYIRDGRLLEGDKDVDIGVFERDYDKPKIIAALKDSGRFRIVRVDNHAERLRAIHRNGVWIDIFPYFSEGEKTWHAGSVVRWWHEPFDLAPYVLEGQDFMIPADTDAYLTWNYGPSWREPDSLFDVYKDAPNAEIMSPDHLRYFAWRKCFEGVRMHNWEKLIKILTDYPEIKNGNPFLDKLQHIAQEQYRRTKNFNDPE